MPLAFLPSQCGESAACFWSTAIVSLKCSSPGFEDDILTVVWVNGLMKGRRATVLNATRSMYAKLGMKERQVPSSPLQMGRASLIPTKSRSRLYALRHT
jgi:hypothetical protein